MDTAGRNAVFCRIPFLCFELKQIQNAFLRIDTTLLNSLSFHFYLQDSHFQLETRFTVDRVSLPTCVILDLGHYHILDTLKCI
jgi:hypothetical protein